MKKIAFDVMGNDNGVEAGVKAALQFVSENKNYKVFLVGKEAEISNFITTQNDNIEIIDAEEVDLSKGPRALRKLDNSMSIAINMVKEGEADAVLSSGDSGTYLSLTTLMLKRIDGVKRPAFMPVIPTIVKGKKFLLLDAGANLVTTEEMLVQWASLGEVFAKVILEVESPRVGIVNIGTEDKKGFDYHIEANKQLKSQDEINYVGFVETRDLLAHEVDVAVADGYGGNLVLKTMEGTVLSLLKLIKQELTSKLIYKIGAGLAKGAFNEIKETLDYRNVGAAWILGLNGIAIKSHGGSDEKAYLGAFGQIKEAVDKDALAKFKESFNQGGDNE